MTSREKKAIFIAVLYSFHVAGGERKHVSAGLPRPLLTHLRDFGPKIALYCIQNRKVRKGVKEIKNENGNPL